LHLRGFRNLNEPFPSAEESSRAFSKQGHIAAHALSPAGSPCMNF